MVSRIKLATLFRGVLLTVDVLVQVTGVDGGAGTLLTVDVLACPEAAEAELRGVGLGTLLTVRNRL